MTVAAFKVQADEAHSGSGMSKFVALTDLDSKNWTTAQAKRIWRINAAVAGYFAKHPDTLDYRTQEGQDYFFAICWWYMTHPLVDEAAPVKPTATEMRRREAELDAFVASLKH